MSKNENNQINGFDDIEKPIKRVTGKKAEDNLTDNALYNILPDRYLRKDENGDVIEDASGLFERVAKNVALADVVYAQDLDKYGNFTLEATPSDLCPVGTDSKKRELCDKFFGEDVSLDSDETIQITEENVHAFSYDTLVPKIPEEAQKHIEFIANLFEEQMVKLGYMPNSPTLMNAGDELQQLSACFVISPKDDIDNIHQVAKEAASIFQSGGGNGYGFWKLRPYGDTVGSTGGIASGPISFMRTYDQMCDTIAQGGKRRGAQMGIMRVDHPDIIEFIHAKNKDVSLAHTLLLNDPDDYTHNSFEEALEEARDLIIETEDGTKKVPKHLRNASEGHLSNFNISVGATEEFMEAVKNDEEYELINPRTDEPYIANEKTKEMYGWFDMDEYVEVGKKLTLPAKEIWERILQGAHENGEPGLIYLDRVNDKHSFDIDEHPEHEIKATNPCVTGDTRIHTSKGMIKAEKLYQLGLSNDVVVDGRLSDEITKEASSVYKTGVKDIYKLETEEGYEIELTKDHKIKTDNGWITAEELSKGDKIHINNRKGLFGRQGSIKEGQVFGWLHTEDKINKDEKNIMKMDDSEIEEFQNTCNLIDDYIEIFNTGYMKKQSFVNEYAVQDKLYQYIKSERSVEDKNIVPEFLFEVSEEMVKGYMQVLFTKYGSINENDKLTIEFNNDNKQYLTDIQQLLLNIGIYSKITENKLTIEESDLYVFQEEIGFLSEEKQTKFTSELKELENPNTTEFKAMVESVEYTGREETVYDLTEPDTHSFIANGIVVHNCGEQPLEEYESCNLGHINLSTCVDKETPDWREWSQNKEGELEELISDFLQESVDWNILDKRIKMGTHFLENVVTMSSFPVDKITEKVGNNRKIGLGIMGLAQMYIQMGIKYGTEEGDEVAKQIMKYINHESKKVSQDIALGNNGFNARGSFDNWHKSKYADPTSYPEWFKQHVGEDPEDWEDGYPIRNHNTTTIAPTGCVDEESLISTTEGLEKIGDMADKIPSEFERWEDINKSVVTEDGIKQSTAFYDAGFTNVKTIKTKHGFEVSSTLNHKFRTVNDGGEIVWKKAEEFDEGDTIVQMRNTFKSSENTKLDTSEKDNFNHNTDGNLVLPNTMTEELAEFLGYWMGNRYKNESVGIKLILNPSNNECVEYVKELGRSVFGVDPIVENKDTKTVLFGGRHLSRYFEDNGWVKHDRNTREKSDSSFVPKEIMKSSESVARSFCRGLFESEGSISEKVELSTFSEKLSKQVQTLLLSLGHLFVRESVEYEKSGENQFGERTRYVIRGANNYEDKKFIDEIGTFTKDIDFELSECSYENDLVPNRVVNKPTLGSKSDEFGDYVHTMESIRSENSVIADGGKPITDYVFSVIDSVEDGVAYTKDISVPDNTQYIANGFISHNTTSMLGDTTGGCEPIYNVAYYKNVTEDVQGDEMLVEFDDYFLRLLEANDIGVKEAKREAQELMSNNEFDGIKSMETVPDEIGGLFVTTDQLSAKQHASVQCALQEGVDSAISKTINAPSDSTIEDTHESFLYVYDNGGKGVTYYRDGSRAKQVLTTREQNQEEINPVEKVNNMLEKGEIDPEDINIPNNVSVDTNELKPKERQKRLVGTTEKINTGYGNLFVTINEIDGEPFEVFAQIGKSGGYTYSFTESTARLISLCLRCGIPIEEVTKQIEGIRSPKISWDKGDKVFSVPDGISLALERYESSDINTGNSVTKDVSEDDSEKEQQNKDEDANTKSLIKSGENPECPECSSFSLYYSEGCKKCESCGWSEC